MAPGRTPRRSSALTAYALLVSVAGAFAVIAVAGLSDVGTSLAAHPVPLVALVLALVVSELTEVPAARRDSSVSTTTISTTFAVALIVVGPLWLAMVAQVATGVVDALHNRCRPIQLAFNAGQYALCLLAARVVLSATSGADLLGHHRPFEGADLLPALAAGAAFGLTNHVLMAVFLLEISAVLIALGPVAALLAEVSFMVPLIALPVLAVRRTALLAATREHQSLHDPLTGLANRALFRSSVERAIARQHERGVAVLLLDLDHFEDVNDTLGHHVGDDLLCEVAARLTRAAAADTDATTTVARLGGDEFAILLTAEQPLERASALATTLLRDLSRPVEVAHTRLTVQAANRLLLLPQLRDAIDAGELVVEHQPQVDALTGSLVAVEALVRWEHPTLGRLEPAAFIGAAESAGLIAPITTYVLETALGALASWRAEGWCGSLAVNLSARQLSDLSLPAHVGSLLELSGVPASALTVEVTESSLVADPRAARRILTSLRKMGVQLAIDDFATGYPSLVLLQRLAVDELKVDRSFVTP